MVERTQVWVKLSAMPADAIPFIKREFVRAKETCRHCHGRGTTGHLSKPTRDRRNGNTLNAGTALPCRCLLVDLNAVRDEIEAEKVRQAPPAAAKSKESDNGGPQ